MNTRKEVLFFSFLEDGKVTRRSLLLAVADAAAGAAAAVDAVRNVEAHEQQQAAAGGEAATPAALEGSATEKKGSKGVFGGIFGGGSK